MKTLKNAGTYEILDEPSNLINKICNAARTCYQSQEKSTEGSNIKLVRNLIKRGHMAMIEFADMTVKFKNICRGFTHEMVRHRLCSFGQESTRYVDESDFNCVVPPHKNNDGKIIEIVIQIEKNHTVKHKLSLNEWFELNEQAYRSLREKEWKPEDARQVLPIGIKSEIVVKANIREWRHIFKMRCDKYAHWEIRGVMLQLLNNCKKNIPIVFDDFIFYTKDPVQKQEYFDDLTHQLIVDNKIYARNY